MSGSMGFGFQHLEQLSFRLIAPDRPGLGKSSMHSQKTLETWADDIAILLKHAGISHCAALGFSQGSAFVLALAKTCELSAEAIVNAVAHRDYDSNGIERVLRACELKRKLKSIELQEVAGIRHRETFQRNYLDQLLKEELIERTIPEKPKSRLQKYRLPHKGKM